MSASNSNAGSKMIKIPMNIMQTWKTTKLPDKWQASQTAIKSYMPHWKYTLMTDHDNLTFVKIYFPDFLSYFERFEYPIQRADAIRYMWMYVHGGLYLDLDLEIIQCLDELFYEDCDLYLVGSAILGAVYTNAFFAAKPNLPIMLQFLRDMQMPYKFWHVGKHLKVVNSTGPMMFTKGINRSYQNKDKLKIIQRELIIPCTICDEKPCCLEGGYVRLLGGTSWSGSDTDFYTFLFCKQRYIVMFIILVVIIVVILIIRKRKTSSSRYTSSSRNK